MKQIDQLATWIAYIEGELSDEEVSQLEAAMQQDENLALQIEGLRLLALECPDDLDLETFILRKQAELKGKWWK